MACVLASSACSPVAASCTRLPPRSLAVKQAASARARSAEKSPLPASKRHYADAGGRREHPPEVRAAVVRDRRAQVARALERGLGLGAAQQQRELVAARAREQLARTELAAQHAGEPPYEFIAGGMAGRVVHQLELVEVQVQQRHVLVAARAQELAAALLERRAVDEPVSESVVARRIRRAAATRFSCVPRARSAG
jgi:hypothetical protein